MPLRAKPETMDFRSLRLEAGYIDIYDSAWEDLRFPAQAINPPGAASDPSLEATTGLLLFAHTATNMVAGVAQMPHSWAEGTVISPHVHWMKTTSAAGDVLWQLEYEVVANGDVAPLTYSNVLTASSAVAGTVDDDTANRALISSFGEVNMQDKKASCLIFWKLSRTPGEAADTYGAAARLIEFDIHYKVDSFGSQGLYTKYDRN